MLNTKNYVKRSYFVKNLSFLFFTLRPLRLKYFKSYLPLNVNIKNYAPIVYE
ncbi:hypothetical protein AVDCRST_MAG84-6555 [uncultured Microcoleus sp.]|uniref:Uncharacterized protein n=1 Tax=uncultured Microcoleus sp. TaxID=259945 RepID=A0A6J4PBL9_9CYAN|nr:hypothetical protein AVDCRST_MAG84-6555 [uncultured Microcoleus sp.]